MSPDLLSVTCLILHVACMTTLVYSDVQAEKQHQGLVQGIEGFNKSALGHVSTTEKNSLPDSESMYLPRPSDGYLSGSNDFYL